MRLALLLLATVLSGCAPPTPVVDTRLAKAPAWATEDCGTLEPIPADDGDPAVRARHYGAVRSQYEECRDRHRLLAARERTITKTP